MHEWPLIFTAESVRGIDENRKTMTRRLPTRHNTLASRFPSTGFTSEGWENMLWEEARLEHGELIVPRRITHHGKTVDLIERLTPKVKAGDVIRVKESWSLGLNACDHPVIQYQALPYDHHPTADELEALNAIGLTEMLKEGRLLTEEELDWCDAHHFTDEDFGGRWRSPMFMPTWACRYRLRVLDSRWERLQEITPADAVSEGIERVSDAQYWAWRDYTGNNQLLSPVMSYQSLWDRINGKKYPWDSNPWVLVYTFERLKESGGDDRGSTISGMHNSVR